MSIKKVNQSIAWGRKGKYRVPPIKNLTSAKVCEEVL